MNHRLAVFAPKIGVLSETFIQRHIQDLLPGGTVAVTGTVDGPSSGHWDVDCPVFVLDRAGNNGLKQQMVQAITRKLHLRPADRLVNVKRFLQDHHVQVLMGEYLDSSLPWINLADELGIRFFAHGHGYDVSMRLRQPKWRAEYLRYNQATGVIVVSKASRLRLLELGLMPEKVHVVPCGIDVPAEPLTKEAQKTIRFVAVGRMVAKKAPILTLDAFRRAARVCPNIRLDYVGTGNLLAAAHQFILAFNLYDRITLHRGQPSEVVYKLMRDADVFLQHSMTDPETGDEEGLPVSILEAMANSLPIVSTLHAGIPEAVLDGCTGYLVKEGDSVGMAERLISLTRDPDLRRCMGEAGWHRAKEHFSWEKERSELLRILGLAYENAPRPAECLL